jgi:pilus assembly protein CpaE
MGAYVVSDHEPTTGQIREVLRREGQDCPLANVVSLGRAADFLAGAKPELVVVALSPDPDRTLAVLVALRAQTQAPILAVGPASDPKLILQALRAGANDYVDEAEIQTDLRAGLGRVRVGLHAQGKPGRLVALLSPRGGSGASTLAVNLATVLAGEHKSALLIDMKRAAGDLADLLDLRPSHTLADLSQHASRMDRVMFEGALVRHGSGVHLLAAPRTFLEMAHVTPEGVRQALLVGRSIFPYVLADLECSFQPEAAEVLRQADVILLVLRLDFTCLRGTRHALEYLKELGVDPERVRLVANRHGQPKEVPAASAAEALGVKIFHCVPEDATTVNRANNSGVPLVLESPRAKVARSLTALAHSINGHHKGH